MWQAARAPRTMRILPAKSTSEKVIIGFTSSSQWSETDAQCSAYYVIRLVPCRFLDDYFLSSHRWCHRRDSLARAFERFRVNRMLAILQRCQKRLVPRSPSHSCICFPESRTGVPRVYLCIIYNCVGQMRPKWPQLVAWLTVFSSATERKIVSIVLLQIFSRKLAPTVRPKYATLHQQKLPACKVLNLGLVKRLGNFCSIIAGMWGSADKYVVLVFMRLNSYMCRAHDGAA